MCVRMCLCVCVCVCVCVCIVFHTVRAAVDHCHGRTHNTTPTALYMCMRTAAMFECVQYNVINQRIQQEPV